MPTYIARGENPPHAEWDDRYQYTQEILSNIQPTLPELRGAQLHCFTRDPKHSFYALRTCRELGETEKGALKAQGLEILSQCDGPIYPII